MNEILNHPAVYPFVSLGIPGPIDFGPIFNHCFFLILENEGGFFMLHPAQDGLEIHTCFLEDHRGKEATLAAWELLEICFHRWGTSRLATKVPLGNRAADFFTRAHGFTRIGQDQTYRFYEMTREDYQRVLREEEAVCQPLSQS